MSDIFLYSIDNGLRTPIIGHIDQEIGDSGGLEFLDSGINIKRELIGVLGFERTDKHLEQRKEALLFSELSGNMEDAPPRSYYPGERSSSLFQNRHRTMVELAKRGKEGRVLLPTQAQVSKALRAQNEA